MRDGAPVTVRVPPAPRITPVAEDGRCGWC